MLLGLLDGAAWLAIWTGPNVPRLSGRWPLQIAFLSSLCLATACCCDIPVRRAGAAMAGNGAQWRALSTVADDDDDDDEIDIANWRPPVSEPPAAAINAVDKADAIAIDESDLPANDHANGLDDDTTKVRSILSMCHCLATTLTWGP